MVVPSTQHIMSGYQEKKNYKAYQKAKKNLKSWSKHQNQTCMAGMLELSDWEFKTTMISMLKALMDKVDSMQEQMGSVSRKMENLRKNQKEMLDWIQLKKKSELEDI